MTAGDIAARFSCSWATSSRHLEVLQEAGLVRVEKKGRGRIYAAVYEHLHRVAGDWLARFARDAKRTP